MTADLTPLETLHAAVQTFVNETHEHAVVVQHALVVWEQVRLDDDGEALRELRYSLPSDGASLAGALGLATAADQMIRRDCINVRDD